MSKIKVFGYQTCLHLVVLRGYSCQAWRTLEDDKYGTLCKAKAFSFHHLSPLFYLCGQFLRQPQKYKRRKHLRGQSWVGSKRSGAKELSSQAPPLSTPTVPFGSSANFQRNPSDPGLPPLWHPLNTGHSSLLFTFQPSTVTCTHRDQKPFRPQPRSPAGGRASADSSPLGLLAFV